MSTITVTNCEGCTQEVTTTTVKKVIGVDVPPPVETHYSGYAVHPCGPGETESAYCYKPQPMEYNFTSTSGTNLGTAKYQTTTITTVGPLNCPIPEPPTISFFGVLVLSLVIIKCLRKRYADQSSEEK